MSTIILCMSRFNHVLSGDTLRRDAISTLNFGNVWHSITMFPFNIIQAELNGDKVLSKMTEVIYFVEKICIH